MHSANGSCILFSFLYPDARGHAEGGGDGGKDGDGDVQNLLPEFVLVHFLELRIES